MKSLIVLFLVTIAVVFICIQPGTCQTTEASAEEKGTESDSVDPKLDIMLVLDNSGSMKKNDPRFLTREVVTNYVNNLDAGSHLGMVIFDREAELVEPLGELMDQEDKTRFLESLAKVDFKGKFTNSPAGIERAIYELKTSVRKDARKVIIFLTDGIVDTGDKAKDLEKEKWLENDLAEESRQEGIRIFGVAFTDKADFRLIQTLALKTEGEYFRAYKPEDIQDVFQQINAIITKPPPKPEAQVAQSQQEEPAPVKPEEASPAPAPVQAPKKEKQVFTLLAGIILALLLVIVFLFFVFKRKSKPKDGEIRPDAIGRGEGPPMPKAHLVDSNKIVSEKPLLLDRTTTAIGRDAGNDIVIPKETVSSQHAAIEFKSGHFYLEDQRSANGTKLNDQKIEANKPIRLKSGDRITFDIYEFTFMIPGQAPLGKTVLAGSGAVGQPRGTILRSSKPNDEDSKPDLKEKEPDQKPAPDDAGGKEQKQKDSPVKPTEEERKTKLKASMCPNHASMRATEICSLCKTAFCKRCMTEIEGNKVCSNCAEKINKK
jgi:pSer/pThr/pTyr-binding forkhead associated (FHA) protein/Mg-chelatase subunit ChlD